MRRPILVATLALVAGCWSQAPAPPITPPPPVQQAQVQPPAPPPQPREPAWKTQWPYLPPPRLTQSVKGWTAEQWNQQLHDLDLQASIDAAFALYHLGDDGDYYLFKALRSPDAHVRQSATGTIRWTVLKDRKDILFPELLRLVTDISIYTRERAIAGMRACGYLDEEGIRQVRATVANSPQNVRNHIEEELARSRK